MPMSSAKYRKYKRCVSKVSAKDGRVNPFAVCRASTGYGLKKKMGKDKLYRVPIYDATTDESHMIDVKAKNSYDATVKAKKKYLKSSNTLYRNLELMRES